MFTKNNLKIKRTSEGKAAFWVGGGGRRNTFEALIVLRPTIDGGYRLPDPVFIRQSGTLANCTDQALVELHEKDIILSIKGTLPVMGANPDIEQEAVQVTDFYRAEDGNEYAKVGDYEVRVKVDKIPESAIKGMSEYHNRVGWFFVYMYPPEETSKPENKVIVA